MVESSERYSIQRPNLISFLQIVGFTVLLSLFFSFGAQAQPVSIDSLRGALQTAGNSAERVNLLNQLAFELRDTRHEQAMHYAKEAEELALSLKDTLNLARAKGNIGWISYRRGEWESTFRYSREAYDLSKAIGDANETAMNLNNLGALFYQQQNYWQAIEMFKDAYERVRGTEHTFTIIRSLNNMALNMIRAGEPDSAMVYANESLLVNELAGRPYSVSFPYRVIGDVYAYRGDLHEALIWYENALDIARVRRLPSFEASVLHRLGHTWLELGDSEKTIMYLKEGEALSLQANLRDELSMTYLHLSHLYDHLGNIPEAYRYQSMHLEMLNELASRDMKNRLAIIQGMFEAERLEAGLRVLEVENQLKREQLEWANLATRISVVVVILVVILLVIVLLMYQRIRTTNLDLQIKSEKIQEQNKELEVQTRKLSEMNRSKNILFSVLSHDLRSPVGQMKTMLELLNDKTLSHREFMDNIHQLRYGTDQLHFTLDNLLKWARSQMEGFKAEPVVVELREAVNRSINFLEESAHRKSISIENLVEADLKVVSDADHLDIILRNLLSNAIKFSHNGNRVEIGGQKSNDAVMFFVRDYGTGMSKDLIDLVLTGNDELLTSLKGTSAENGHGIGLNLVRTFIKMNNGVLNVASESDKGSTMFVTLPSG